MHTVDTQTGRSRPDFNELYRELHHRVEAATRAWAPASDVDDVMQETWTAVIASWDSFEGRSKVSTWVLGIAWRQSKKHWRDRASRQSRTTDADRRPEVRSAGVADHSAWSDPVRLAVSRIEADQVLAAVAELPERYRSIIVLRDLRGISAPEAERALAVSSENQRVLLHRARRQVQATLGERTIAV